LAGTLKEKCSTRSFQGKNGGNEGKKQIETLINSLGRSKKTLWTLIKEKRTRTKFLVSWEKKEKNGLPDLKRRLVDFLNQKKPV